MSNPRCGLCDQHDAKPRAGRLGRYALTCDTCESRRGTTTKPAADLTTFARRTGLR